MYKKKAHTHFISKPSLHSDGETAVVWNQCLLVIGPLTFGRQANHINSAPLQCLQWTPTRSVHCPWNKASESSIFLRFYLRVFAGFREAGGDAAVCFLSTAGGQTSWVNHIHSGFTISDSFIFCFLCYFLHISNKSIQSVQNLPASLGHFGSSWLDSWLLEKKNETNLEHF